MPRHTCPENWAPLSPPLYSDLVIAWRKSEPLTRNKQALIDFISGME